MQYNTLRKRSSYIPLKIETGEFLPVKGGISARYNIASRNNRNFSRIQNNY